MKQAPWRIPLLLTGLVLAAALLPALPQPQSYHRFVDTRALLGLPNALNVLSNLPLLLAGLLGLRILKKGVSKDETGLPYAIFFLALIAVAAGSAGYHLAPDNARLLGDRLPIAVSLAPLLGALLAESGQARPWTLPWLMALGLASVLWWTISPRWGAETLWPYLAFQLGCMAALLTLAPGVARGGMLLLALGLYGAALAAEWMDRAIFAWSGQILSGHSLKHLLAASAALLVVLRLNLLGNKTPASSH